MRRQTYFPIRTFSDMSQHLKGLWVQIKDDAPLLTASSTASGTVFLEGEGSREMPIGPGMGCRTPKPWDLGSGGANWLTS